MAVFFTSDTLPTRTDVWHDESIVLTGNPIATFVSATQMYTTFSFQSTPLNGDSFTQSVFLKAGTYTFTALGAIGSNEGKIDWYIDGAIVVTGQDWYDAGGALNVAKTASVVIATDGYHVLKGVVNGKNGAASDYYIVLTRMSFKLTAGD